MRNKVLVFDMDGTIANLYGVKGWLEDLQSESTRPYDVAEPLFDMDVLNVLLTTLQDLGWKIAITSWLSKNGSFMYDLEVEDSKKAWLERYDFPYDFINIVRYGKDKSECTEDLGGYQILIDDEEPNRKAWKNGKAIAPNNLVDFLLDLIEKEVG